MPGVPVVRSAKVLGFQEPDGHAEIVLDDVRVSASNLSAGEGDGFMIDQHGSKGARQQIAAIKLVVPAMACRVTDPAIQVHGGAGVSEDTPLAAMYAWHRAMRVFDGPDEVHLMSVAKVELPRGRVLA